MTTLTLKDVSSGTDLTRGQKVLLGFFLVAFLTALAVVLIGALAPEVATVDGAVDMDTLYTSAVTQLGVILAALFVGFKL